MSGFCIGVTWMNGGSKALAETHPNVFLCTSVGERDGIETPFSSSSLFLTLAEAKIGTLHDCDAHDATDCRLKICFEEQWGLHQHCYPSVGCEWVQGYQIYREIDLLGADGDAAAIE